ncbi:hypothetical protein BABINDRAFT_7407 [Babjeviella inositovora NRRL Y-12698]|uniref:Squalene synthase ERG9 n=1 Tax=Babjeviella inositovora NRRL Y-12698 TaxID=984486 RepID=A0A1E3QSL6_9ASCO|nr:uncharacterized protein BABINDRAFT_7407 [Babjeviella inositovora NRRL Y-12698]ODQ80706.1 hypothetical protein BABINDRAFT_7407 [Babjeviella inositovora NRRL Y-12698]
MGKLTQLLLHPTEVLALIQYKYFKHEKHPRDPTQEPASLQRCYELLRVTSRSFAAVIQELHPELRDAIMLFYIILRALDTVEDDMSIDPKIKVPLLRGFDAKLLTKNWTFNGNAPGEKDRVVLVEFDQILIEYHKLKPAYQDIIKDITHRMGNGMADYIMDENFNTNGVATKKDYDLYCHYVAGLVGEGLTKMIVVAQFGDESLADKMYLADSMGLFLQKVNIIRDYYEDLCDGRSFWPREIWAKHCTALPDFAAASDDTKGLDCISEMVEDALGHATDVLTYLSLIRDQSTFNFCAIPQVMAIATLELIYQNPAILHRANVKIRKSLTCKLILESRTMPGVVHIFERFVAKIHHKSNVTDANYLSMGIICGKIVQTIECMYPVDPIQKQSQLGAGAANPVVQVIRARQQMDDEMAQIMIAERMKVNLVLMLVGLLVVSLVYVIADQKHS